MNNEVLIVGAGPSGLAMAISLSNQGVPYKIIDENEGPGSASRAMAIQARVLEFYKQFGFADRVVEKGIVADTLNLYKDKKGIAKIPIGKIGNGMSPYPYVLTLPQDIHERILVDELEKIGGEISWKQELLRFKDDGDSVIATINTPDGEITKTFAYICGCDGASSVVRKALDIDFPGGTYRQSFFVADIENGTELKGASMGFYDNYFCMGFPIRTTGQLRLIGLIPENLKVGSEAPKDFTALIPHVERILPIQVKKVNWYSPYRSHHRVAEKFRLGRAFICGDAGHIHSPAGGQGMNTGISDALNLAWKLGAVMKGKASSNILDTYEPERIKFAQILVSTTDKAFQIMTNSRIVKNFVIPFFAPKLLRFNALKKIMFKAISQTNLNYQQSELSVGEYGAIKGGDRLPWINTSTINNFEPLKSYDWQIHVYGTITQNVKQLAYETGIPMYNVSWNKPMNAQGIKENSVFLVRPDSYVSVATDFKNLDPIKNMIHKYSIRRLN
ncbi:FAD-dependent monooxygenase [Mammaliicoccus lentus]|uniref:FAD-dependent monooxygenase n=2 Tax=Mammaliicoccus lentus TaxID=42858 RepID=UPI0024A82A44|nr:FAD-dependent monooxygenase [Mammaliicoccus lentus]WHI54436.1 FAD-dependent monooxygenase [Mammaliicoccus lentus]WHI56958.1 FAD-dependent monooxygenase [Mammaliicoccus lentus]WHI64803.1 FAD-dependent monooxygenase [Mammaliicoccus lentus]WHI85696.1 FAD-dependent monooxygenase [Mammaliicoccus lentus]WHI90204.1 FAD-dependent monooxygenase [Mammaliicoccus lentus]